MPTTKVKISEQVLYMLKGGNPKAATTVQIEDISEYIGQALNSIFKQDFISINLPSGETIPQGAMIATYDNSGAGYAPVSYNGVSKVALPATPIALPRNIGVYSICFVGDYNNDFIPIQTGMQSLIKGEKLLSNLLGQVGYEVVGNTAIFNQDLTATYSGKNLVIKLVVFDINSYDDFTALPIPADMEEQLVTQAYKFFSAQEPANKIDDPSVEQNKK